MKHIAFDKCSVAWFRLAECVSRGEQERAFGVYRLLSHSLDDQALVQQLAGDLHLAFGEDQVALDKFERALNLYRDSGRVQAAVAIYEHMMTIDPAIHVHRAYLANIYEQMSADQKDRTTGHTSFEHALLAGEWDQAAQFAAQAGPAAGSMYEQLVQKQLEKGVSEKDVRESVCHAIDIFVAEGNDTRMQVFLTKLKKVSLAAHKQATEYLRGQEKDESGEEHTEEKV